MTGLHKEHVMRNFLSGCCLVTLMFAAHQAGATTPSLSGTIIPSASQIIDGNLNLWTLSGGVAYENGKPTPSSGVILLLCYGGVVYQENSQHNWWLWDDNTAQVAEPYGSPSNLWASSSDPRVISAGGAAIPVATQIVDSGHAVWTMSGGQAYENGKLTPSSGVIELLYAKNTVYQENASHHWWFWQNGAWVATTAPTAPSASGATIPSAADIVDEGRNLWTLSGGKAYENSSVTPSSGVILLLFYGGEVYQENAQHKWWGWNGSAWIATASDPRVAPVVAYVASTSGGQPSVTAIDTATNLVSATYPVYSPSGFAASSMVVTPNGRYVYVAGNSTDPYGSVVVIDTVVGGSVTSIAVPYAPTGIVASPDGTKVYVVSAEFTFDEYPFQTSMISTIDVATNLVVASLELPDYDSTIAISPDGKTLYLSAYDSCGCASQMNSAFIDVVDTVSNSLASHIGFPAPPVNGNPVVGGDSNSIFSAVLAPNDAKLYSNYSYDYATQATAGTVNEVAIFNPVTGAQTNSIPAVLLAQVFSPDSKYLYGMGLGGVGVINTATNVSSTAVAGVPGASNLAITPDGQHLYITDTTTNDVLVADTATFTISTSIPMSLAGGAIAIVSAQ
jgi:YVTN family beta-propeller protein